MSTQANGATIFTRIMVARRERQARPRFLEQLDGPEAPRKFKLDKEDMVIGRAEDADVRLTSSRASRQHALLHRRGEDYVVRDNDSRNGIFLNGLKVHSAALRDGDTVQFADCVFTYHES